MCSEQRALIPFGLIGFLISFGEGVIFFFLFFFSSNKSSAGEVCDYVKHLHCTANNPAVQLFPILNVSIHLKHSAGNKETSSAWQVRHCQKNSEEMSGNENGSR